MIWALRLRHPAKNLGEQFAGARLSSLCCSPSQAEITEDNATGPRDYPGFAIKTIALTAARQVEGLTHTSSDSFVCILTSILPKQYGPPLRSGEGVVVSPDSNFFFTSSTTAR